MAERFGVAGRVRFLGPQADVTPFLGAADAFLLPSWYDPFPNACLEALASGLPLIVSTTSGTAELVRPGENGFVCQAGNADDLRQKMEVLRPRLGETAVREAASNTVSELTPENMLGQFADLYRHLGVT
jgi:UDP-glucose:(heptosyl)LPS alpha-1,3-glucosyltransferase